MLNLRLLVVFIEPPTRDSLLIQMPFQSTWHSFQDVVILIILFLPQIFFENILGSKYCGGQNIEPT